MNAEVFLCIVVLEYPTSWHINQGGDPSMTGYWSCCSEFSTLPESWNQTQKDGTKGNRTLNPFC